MCRKSFVFSNVRLFSFECLNLVYKYYFKIPWFYRFCVGTRNVNSVLHFGYLVGYSVVILRPYNYCDLNKSNKSTKGTLTSLPDDSLLRFRYVIYRSYTRVLPFSTFYFVHHLYDSSLLIVGTEVRVSKKLIFFKKKFHIYLSNAINTTLFISFT